MAEVLLQSPSGAAAGSWIEEHGQIRKSDTQSLSALARLDGQPCFLKLYRHTSPLHKAMFALGVARPLRNFSAARELDALGVAVPRPLACLQVPDGILLVIEGLTEGSNLLDLWRRPLEENQMVPIMQAAGENLAALHSAGYAHGDCKWSNLFWDGVRVFLVDLDSARKSELRSSAQARDLARFTVNAEQLRIGSRVFEVFLEAYSQRLGDSRRAVVQRMLPVLLQYRKKYLARHDSSAQRLI
jgi:tRNA A-37 threonylcarbamoyl transferase component Bud32